jgi:hypothetical protein
MSQGQGGSYNSHPWKMDNVHLGNMKIHLTLQVQQLTNGVWASNGSTSSYLNRSGRDHTSLNDEDGRSSINDNSNGDSRIMDIISAILALDPNAQVSVNGDGVDEITWHDDNPNNITGEQIIAKQAELQADYDAKQYQRDRAKEYPSIEDQLDDLYHNGIDGWKTTIKAVKDKYPKE